MISKKRAIRNLFSLKKSHPRLFNDLLKEFKNMSAGGPGAPHRVGYNWSTVREYYYKDWTDEDFEEVLNHFENSMKDG